MREKLLLIAERIRRKATDYEPDMPSEAELLRDIAEAIEEELAQPTAVYACVGCGAKISSDGSWSELHQGHCIYR